jgi:aminoglycoside/choline kinase family phosphotransferase
VNPEIRDFLASVLGESDYTITALHGDGSERRFYRLAIRNQTFVMLEHLGGGEENESYYRIGNHLRSRGVPVPRFYAYNRQGLFLLEDLGDEHLTDRVLLSDESGIEQLYRQAVDALIHMQRYATPGFRSEYCFDTPFYDQRLALEREGLYFRDAFLTTYLNLRNLPSGLDHELADLSTYVEHERRRVLLHRDFQSRNLMLKEGRLHVIDFQGARLGPPQYDLAALLWDPYVDLPHPLKERLFQYYMDEMGIKNQAQFREHFNYIALHRAMQILGAFGFLTRIKNKPFFEQYIPVAIKNILTLTFLLDLRLYPALKETIGRLKEMYALS